MQKAPFAHGKGGLSEISVAFWGQEDYNTITKAE
jgi:hypothetical protein